MNKLNKTFANIGMLLILLGLPLLGILAAKKPLADYLEFPPLTRYVHHADFSWPVFIGLAVALAAILIHFIARVLKSQFSFPSAVTDDRSPVTDHCFASPPLPLSASPLPSSALRLPPSAFPLWGWLGLAFTALAWVMAWTRVPWFSALQGFTFTPLWIGYVVVVNALTYRRTGHCMLRDRPGYMLKLFLFSAVFWWYFEYLNRFVQNWCYEGVSGFSRLQYFLFATLPFSTVLPAVLGTNELLESRPRLSAGLDDFVRVTIGKKDLTADKRGWTQMYSGYHQGADAHHSGGICALMNRSILSTLPRLSAFICGFTRHLPAWSALIVFSAGLILIGIWPDYLFPLLWISPLVIIISWQALCGGETVLSGIARGDWRKVWTLAMSALICGFFWEMWNYHSLAKWVYTVPFVNRFHVFEMPILGYAGYLPFGLECAAVAAMLTPRREKSLAGGAEDAERRDVTQSRKGAKDCLSTVPPKHAGICRYGNGIIMTVIAVYFFLVPGMLVMRDIADPNMRTEGIPAIAWRIHRRLAPRIEKWARQRVASGKAAGLYLYDVPSTEWPMFGSVYYLWATESLQEAWEKITVCRRKSRGFMPGAPLRRRSTW
jgi:hypothetical protein